jgi:hypothetical protein
MSTRELPGDRERFALEVERNRSKLGHDFDLHRFPATKIAPGNLWAPPSRWQEPTARSLVGPPPPLFEHHAARDEMAETFRPDDYLGLNPDLLAAGLSSADAWSHFVDRGYAERRPFNERVWNTPDLRYYRNEIAAETDLLDDESLRRHYSYQGRFEDRVPNDLTAYYNNLRVHLWQVGKVGSISIQRGLFNATGEQSVHVHYVDALHESLPKLGIHYSRILHRHGNFPKLILCGIRDPVERVISGMFQEAESLSRLESVASIDMAISQLCMRVLSDLRYTLNWFDHRFFCDLDVYQRPFPLEQGFDVFERDGVRLFLYRFADLHRIAPDLGEFLGVPGFELPIHNVSRTKPYAAVLDAVDRAVAFTPETARQIYESPLALQFLTPAEREFGLSRYRLGD